MPPLDPSPAESVEGFPIAAWLDLCARLDRAREVYRQILAGEAGRQAGHGTGQRPPAGHGAEAVREIQSVVQAMTDFLARHALAQVPGETARDD